MSCPNRQSSRLSAKRIQEVTKAKFPQVPQPSKRQKTTPQVSIPAKAPIPRVDDFRKVKGRRGKLRFMTEIPVDTLLEIFSHVEPLDLLHLSWATKDLHALITASRNAFLWKRAYENLPAQKPPPCPSGSNIAQYTNLLFGRACQFCGANRVGNIVHWSAQVRICANCARDKFLKCGQDIDQRISSFCAMQWISKGNIPPGNYVMKSEYEKKWRNWEECKSEVERAAYIKKWQKVRHELYMPRYRLYDQWYQSQEVNQLPRAEITRRKRRDAIVAKLQDAGYAAELQRYPINFLPIVRVPTELTEKAWSKMKDDLINLMEDRRQEMLKTKITQALQLRLYALDRKILSTTEATSKHSIMPPTSYIANLEPFRTFFKNLPLEERVSHDHLSGIMTVISIPKITEAWRREANLFLLGLLSKAPPSTSTDEVIDMAPLELATTFFKCNWCTEPISYPRILMHGCLRNRRCKETVEEEGNEEGDEGEEDGEEDESVNAGDDNNHQTLSMTRNEVTVGTVWNNMSSWFGSGWNEGNNQIFVDEEATNFARTIVQVCGEDPNTATLSMMEELDPRLECIRCTSKTKTGKRLVMNWTTALLHDIEIHFEDPLQDSQGWKLLTDEADISATAESETKMSKKWRLVNKCNRCNRFIQAQHLKSHLTQLHNLNLGEDEDANQYYHRPLDTPLKRAPFPVRI